MRALRRVRNRRVLAALGVAAAAVTGLSACDPVGGMSSAAVAITTDQAGTKALERDGVGVRWLSCTAEINGGSNGNGNGNRNGSAANANSKASPSRSGRQVAVVDCNGKTDRDQDITITGKVTEEREGRCVRGDLTAKVAGRTVFRANVLGNCAGDSGTTPRATYRPRPSDDGNDDGDGRPRSTVTVTVTETRWPGK
ncbi:hypothetical protein [Streptomyces sp. NPDC050504]|uniref:hypothetical protein n=1 Tax=Streptomyces sp. NPDC050504 TaxID=3365618 RepID=UPI0037B22E2E